MKKFNPNKNIIITLIIVIIIVSILSITLARRAVNEKASLGQQVVNDTVGVVDKVVFAPVRWFERGIDSVQNLFVTYQENERLKGKIDDYDEMVHQNDSQKREIKNLKEELSLNATLTNYQKTTANVISRSPDSWQDILVVDKGSKDGIKKDMAVMAKKGLIGRIVEVSAHSSKVELLTSANQTSNHFPIRITTSKGDAFGLLKSYDNRRQALVVEELTGAKNVKKGD
ncbi:MAG TPA: rod shape-determining protein MreC, partial [Tetragenococcus sp.]|nr:rod shape-determining protein MreC [Tetragenococcus sp.]